MEWKQVSIEESTWHGLRILVRDSDFDSQHQFIKSAILAYADEAEVPVPQGVIANMEQKEPEPLDWNPGEQNIREQYVSRR